MCQSAQAGGWLLGKHTIPRETLAKDYRTGGIYFAPPIPYGEYTKDYAGGIHHILGAPLGLAHGLLGKGKACGACGGAGCGACGGSGKHGHGDGCGGCGGDGLDGHGGLCGGCGGIGSGHGGKGLFGHGGGLLGGLGHKGKTIATIPASMPSAQCAPSAQAPSCGLCGGKGLLGNGLCGGCGGKGLLGGLGSLCGGCGGKGLLGGLGGHCGSCGGDGLCGNENACGHCGGKGCGHCGGTGLIHGALGAIHGHVQQAMYKLGHGGVEYFVGPGGPVPLTPGYVPYVVTTRSPRDFFAFPPFSERAMNGDVTYTPSSLSGGLTTPVNPSYMSTILRPVAPVTPPPPAPGTRAPAQPGAETPPAPAPGETVPTPPAPAPGEVPAPPTARPGF
jgi:hypothetical protein